MQPNLKKTPRQPRPHRIWQISGGDRFILTLIGSAMTLLLMANVAVAQSNQSDNTGTNPEPINPIVDPRVNPVTPGTIPPGSSDNQLDTDILETANRLSDELKRAYDACIVSRTAAVSVPRRFARGPVDPNAPPCLGSECLELDQKKQEVQAFLDRLDQSQRRQLQQTRSIRLW